MLNSFREAMIAEFTQQPDLYTVVSPSAQIDTAQCAGRLLLSAEHTFILDDKDLENDEELGALYLALLHSVLQAGLMLDAALTLQTVESIPIPPELHHDVKHELAHFFAVRQLLEGQHQSRYENKLAGVLSVRTQLASKKGHMVQPVCKVKISDEVLLDERLYALARIVMAPFYLRYNHKDLSSSDHDQLTEIKRNISKETPLAHSLSFEIDEVLNPFLFEFNTKMLYNE